MCSVNATQSYVCSWACACEILEHLNTVVDDIQGVEAAKEYFQRKVQYLTKQIEKVQELAQEKVKIREGKSIFLRNALVWCVQICPKYLLKCKNCKTFPGAEHLTFDSSFQRYPVALFGPFYM